MMQEFSKAAMSLNANQRAALCILNALAFDAPFQHQFFETTNLSDATRLIKSLMLQEAFIEIRDGGDPHQLLRYFIVCLQKQYEAKARMTELLSSLQLMDIKACMTMPLDGLLYLTPSFRSAEEHFDDANSIAPVFFLCTAHLIAFIVEFQPLSAEPDQPGRVRIRSIRDNPFKFMNDMHSNLQKDGYTAYMDVKNDRLSPGMKAEEHANLNYEMNRVKRLHDSSIELLTAQGFSAK